MPTGLTGVIRLAEGDCVPVMPASGPSGRTGIVRLAAGDCIPVMPASGPSGRTGIIRLVGGAPSGAFWREVYGYGGDDVTSFPAPMGPNLWTGTPARFSSFTPLPDGYGLVEWDTSAPEPPFRHAGGGAAFHLAPLGDVVPWDTQLFTYYEGSPEWNVQPTADNRPLCSYTGGGWATYGLPHAWRTVVGGAVGFIYPTIGDWYGYAGDALADWYLRSDAGNEVAWGARMVRTHATDIGEGAPHNDFECRLLLNGAPVESRTDPTVFTDGVGGKFSTDYIPLNAGKNPVQVEYVLSSGKTVTQNFVVDRSAH